ncbi:hypothetical protein N9L68_02880 [bacterium]|nr:hypothetical protein [bacterium]
MTGSIPDSWENRNGSGGVGTCSGSAARSTSGKYWHPLAALTQTLSADALQQDAEKQQDAEEETQHAGQQERRRLQHAKAEARARYNEGRRLSGQRDAHQARLLGASQLAQKAPTIECAPSLTSPQQKLLQRWDSGELLQELNTAVRAWENGSSCSTDSEHMDIGTFTRRKSRRLIDGWVPPDWRQRLSHSDTA